jgi:hypothetical protein
MPEFDGPSPADLGPDLRARPTFTLSHYRWDGTVGDDGTRRYRLAP